jgi:hypothetical protein
MMTKKHSRARNVALFLAVVPALAGCKMLGLSNGFASSSSLNQRLPADFGAEQLAAGRNALADGNTMGAIDSFQLAKLYPDHAAAASNGLAVAYSHLGRADLTERYFQVAVALAPEDERYRSNLARFHARNPIPRVADPGAALATLLASGPLPIDAPIDIAVGEPAVPAVARGGGITVEEAGTRMRRVSRNEVFISDAPTAPRNVSSSRKRQAVIEVGARRPQAPAFRIGAQAANAAQTSAYPIRAKLAETPAYPIRLKLAPR